MKTVYIKIIHSIETEKGFKIESLSELEELLDKMGWRKNLRSFDLDVLESNLNCESVSISYTDRGWEFMFYDSETKQRIYNPTETCNYLKTMEECPDQLHLFEN